MQIEWTEVCAELWVRPAGSGGPRYIECQGRKIEATNSKATQKGEFLQFTGLSKGPVTYNGREIAVERRITWVDMQSGATESWDYGDSFGIFFSHTCLQGHVAGCPLTLEVSGAKAMPAVESGPAPELFFVPIPRELGSDPQITVAPEHGEPVQFMACQTGSWNGDFHGASGVRFQWFYLSAEQISGSMAHDGAPQRWGEIAKVKPAGGKKAMRLGHRGLGSNKDYAEFQGLMRPDLKYKARQVVAENTIACYDRACARVDGIELDVILTADKTPVINHNFFIEVGGQQLGINGLTTKQFLTAELPRLWDAGDSQSVRDDFYLDGARKRQFQEPLPGDQYPVIAYNRHRPTFAEVLKEISPQSALVNVEIKYPSSANRHIGQGYWGRQTVVLETLRALSQAPKRPAYFSSFDPVVCLLLKYSQQRYPVLFLNDGRLQTTLAPDWQGYLQVANRFDDAVEFALKHGLQGIVTSMAMVRDRLEKIREAVQRGLAMCSWGTLPHDVGGWEKRQLDAGMSAILYDLVDLFGEESE